MKVLDVEDVEAVIEHDSYTTVVPSGKVMVPIRHDSDKKYPEHTNLILKSQDKKILYAVLFDNGHSLKMGDEIEILDLSIEAKYNCKDDYDFVLDKFKIIN